MSKEYQNIKNCRVCGFKHIVPLFSLGNQPLANSLKREINDSEEHYPLTLYFCPKCSLVQLRETVKKEILFDNYVWVTGTSRTTKEYAEIFCNEVLYRVKDLDKSYVLEVASNDGTFLEPFMQKGHKVLGIDPARNIIDIARANGIPTQCKFFGVKAADEVIKEFGQAKVIIARNVLPHVENLHDFVKGLHMSLHKEGLLVLEVHNAKIIYEELHYDSIYHEHLCYFTLKSIEKLLNQFRLFVSDIKESLISGGSFVLYVKKGKTRESLIVQSYRKQEKEAEVNDLSSWENFAKRAQSHREEMLMILKDAISESGPVVGYGASARSSTLLNFCGIDTRFISIIADQNPLKQKRFTAGTHIPIDSPEEVMKRNPASVFILAWNFSEEIIRILKRKFNYVGKCILPLPNSPRILKVSG